MVPMKNDRLIMAVLNPAESLEYTLISFYNNKVVYRFGKAVDVHMGCYTFSEVDALAFYYCTLKGQHLIYVISTLHFKTEAVLSLKSKPSAMAYDSKRKHLIVISDQSIYDDQPSPIISISIPEGSEETLGILPSDTIRVGPITIDEDTQTLYLVMYTLKRTGSAGDL